MAIPFLPRRDDNEPAANETEPDANESTEHEDPPQAADDDVEPVEQLADALNAPEEAEAAGSSQPAGTAGTVEASGFSLGVSALSSADSAADPVSGGADEPDEQPEPTGVDDDSTSRDVDFSTTTAPAAEPATEPTTAEPVRATTPAPEEGSPEEVVPPLGVDHLGNLLSHRDRDVLRPGGGQQVARPARVIALANQKGGVGKTTTTINLGAALAELGSRVLLVDIDPQGSLGVGLGADPQARTRTTYNLLLVDGTTVDDVLIETNVENLHLLPANIDLAAAELLLVQEVAREQALRRVIERVQYRYDFILIDCPPSLGLLTINGLTAADSVLVPLEAEYFALRGMSLLMQTLEKVQARLNPQLRLEGIVATMFDGRTLHAREVLERVRSAFGDSVFKTTINKTIRFAEAPVAGEPILTYRPRSKGADAYRDLAREVLAREPSS